MPRESFLLDRPFHCPLCQQKVARLYPVTHYDHRMRRWRPVNACLACCGLREKDGPTFDLRQHRPIQR